MAGEISVQRFVHFLEEGRGAKWVWGMLFVAAAYLLFQVFIFDLNSRVPFRGLSSPEAMDQAQIAREIARGHGFTTKVMRPLALFQFKTNGRVFPADKIPETYHAPLNPYLNSLFLRLGPVQKWVMSEKVIVYPTDRLIAAIGVAMFLLSILVNYFIAVRLFDTRLAVFGAGLLLLADRFWKFSISGLPQMLMLLIFSLCAYCLLRAIEARYQNKAPTLWLALAGLGFGLLALTHGLAIWIFVGALIFCGLFFRPRGRDTAIMLALFLLVYTPLLVRNYQVCGSATGSAIYSGLFQIRGTESQIMRTMELSFGGVSALTFRNKLQSQSILQLGNIYVFLGQILVAPVFFVALMHFFKRTETGAFRWCIMTMWVTAFFGMSIFGLQTNELQSNDLHILFAPLMTFYGMAFVLVLWSRWEINIPIIRGAFIALIFLISSIPILTTLTAGIQTPVQWPPYVPPYIAILSKWTNDDEVIASDMPWAVAWYADRQSLWLPVKLDDFMAINDYGDYAGKICGLYLTPVTGNLGFISEIIKGEYKEWVPFIMRSVNTREFPKGFPLRAMVPLPIDNECVFYSDRDRWSTKID